MTVLLGLMETIAASPAVRARSASDMAIFAMTPSDFADHP
jgi:hypothetical protein